MKCKMLVRKEGMDRFGETWTEESLRQLTKALQGAGYDVVYDPNKRQVLLFDEIKKDDYDFGQPKILASL